MRNRLCAIIMCLSILLVAKPASACLVQKGLEIDYIKHASVVVVGRIVNYEIVPDNKVRSYARFNVLVDEVLVGQPPETISVYWINSTFGEPKTMGEGPYLIGLREPPHPYHSSPEPEKLTVLQASCAPEFIFEPQSAVAKAIRDMLGVTAK